MMGTIPVPSGWLYQFEFAGMFVQTFVPDPHAEHCQIENVIPLKDGWRWKVSHGRRSEERELRMELHATPLAEGVSLRGRASSSSGESTLDSGLPVWEVKTASGGSGPAFRASSMTAAMRALARHLGALEGSAEGDPTNYNGETI